MAIIVPDFMKKFKPLKNGTDRLDTILANWMFTHSEINKLSENKGVVDRELLVGQLLYREIIDRRRLYMINKLKGKLSFLTREREEKEILGFITSAEMDSNNVRENT